MKFEFTNNLILPRQRSVVGILTFKTNTQLT